MEQVLDTTQLESPKPFSTGLPSWVKIVGSLVNNRAQLQSRVKGTDEWGLEKEFSEDDKSCLIPGFDYKEIEFQIVVSVVGIEAFYGTANVSFPAR